MVLGRAELLIRLLIFRGAHTLAIDQSPWDTRALCNQIDPCGVPISLDNLLQSQHIITNIIFIRAKIGVFIIMTKLTPIQICGFGEAAKATNTIVLLAMITCA